MLEIPKISVIVPVYKAEAYLHRCVDSILAQTFKDFEVLLIDDGSPDNSGKICDEYAQKDKRVRVFHKENGGVSSARNLGLKKSEGKWVTFIDSDDYVSNEMFQYLLNYENFEHIISGYRTFGCSNNDYSLAMTKVNVLDYNAEIIYNSIPSEYSIYLFCWGQLFLNKIIKTNQLCFSEKVKLGEDTNFVMNYLSCVKSAVMIKGYSYFYNVDRICVEKKYSFLVEDFISHIIDLHDSVKRYEKAHSCNINAFFLHNSKVYEKCLIYGLLRVDNFRKYRKNIEVLCKTDRLEFISYYKKCSNRILNVNNICCGYILLKLLKVEFAVKGFIHKIKRLFK